MVSPARCCQDCATAPPGTAQGSRARGCFLAKGLGTRTPPLEAETPLLSRSPDVPGWAWRALRNRTGTKAGEQRCGDPRQDCPWRWAGLQVDTQGLAGGQRRACTTLLTRAPLPAGVLQAQAQHCWLPRAAELSWKSKYGAPGTPTPAPGAGRGCCAVGHWQHSPQNPAPAPQPRGRGCPSAKGKQLRDAAWRDWGAWEEGKLPSRLGAAEGRAAQVKPGLRCSNRAVWAVTRWDRASPFWGWGDKGCWQCPPASSRRHRRVKGAWRSPRTRPCPLQLSAQYELGVPTVSPAPAQLQGLKCFWSCQE